MSEDVFFGLAAVLWLCCAAYAIWGGVHRRWWGLLLAPLGFGLGFVAIMFAMVALSGDRAPGDLAWLGFAPYFAVPFAAVLPVAFGLGLGLSVFRRRDRGPGDEGPQG